MRPTTTHGQPSEPLIRITAALLCTLLSRSMSTEVRDERGEGRGEADGAAAGETPLSCTSQHRPSLLHLHLHPVCAVLHTQPLHLRPRLPSTLSLEPLSFCISNSAPPTHSTPHTAAAASERHCELGRESGAPPLTVPDVRTAVRVHMNSSSVAERGEGSTSPLPPHSTSSLSSSPSLPSWSSLLSAPSLSPFLPLLDEAAVSLLYGQPPPLQPHSSAHTHSQAAASQSSDSALALLDRSLRICLERAWQAALQADCGPASADAAAAAAAAGSAALSPALPSLSSSSSASASAAPASALSSAVSTFLSSLSALDVAARGCSSSAPLSLVQLLDDGGNPQAALAAALKAASNHNDAVRGRIAAAHHTQQLTQTAHAHTHTRSTHSHTQQRADTAQQSET